MMVKELTCQEWRGASHDPIPSVFAFQGGRGFLLDPPMDDNARIETCRRYLRMEYAGNAVGLRRLAKSVAEGAFDAVTITGQGFEGGSANGQVTFEKLAYLTAAMDVLGEVDPDNDTVQPVRGALTTFAYRRIET